MELIHVEFILKHVGIVGCNLDGGFEHYIIYEKTRCVIIECQVATVTVGKFTILS